MKSIYELKQNSILSPIDLRKNSTKIKYIIMIILLLLFCAIWVFPVFWIGVSSFKDVEEFYRNPPTIFPESFHLENVLLAWKETNLGIYFSNTVVYSVIGVIFGTIFDAMLAYALSRLNPYGKKPICQLLFWSMMFPRTLSIVPFYMTMIDFPYLHINLGNTYWPMWLGAATNVFNVLLLKSYFDSISMSFVEAARIDGANSFQIFFKIMLPLSVPIITVVSMFTFNAMWRDFFNPYLFLQDDTKYTLSVYLYNLQQNSSVPMNRFIIILFLSSLPSMIVFLIFQKQIMRGVNIGGVKG